MLAGNSLKLCIGVGFEKSSTLVNKKKDGERYINLNKWPSGVVLPNGITITTFCRLIHPEIANRGGLLYSRHFAGKFQ